MCSKTYEHISVAIKLDRKSQSRQYVHRHFTSMFSSFCCKLRKMCLVSVVYSSVLWLNDDEQSLTIIWSNAFVLWDFPYNASMFFLDLNYNIFF